MGFPRDKWGESSEDLFLRLFLFSPEAFTGLEKAKFSLMYRRQNQAPRACNNGSKMRYYQARRQQIITLAVPNGTRDWITTISREIICITKTKHRNKSSTRTEKYAERTILQTSKATERKEWLRQRIYLCTEPTFLTLEPLFLSVTCKQERT